MGSLERKESSGSIHRIREFELQEIVLNEEYDILQIVGEGWFGKIFLAEHRSTGSEVVLKCLPKDFTSVKDFYKEFHYSHLLSPHKNILKTYDLAFEADGFYVFTQEYAPLGDLTSNVSDIGIGELNSKRVARQIVSALDFMHGKGLVHRDVKLDNILVFKTDFSRVKLCDFGETSRIDAQVRKRNEWQPYSPPEVLAASYDETYRASPTHDVWQFGIVLFVCLTGCLPWQKAQSDDPRYVRYVTWHSRIMVKRPKLFKILSSKAQRMFKKLIEPRIYKRVGITEISKFLDDRWLSKVPERPDTDNESLCPSMYSFHSSLEEKNKLLFTLSKYGVETTVDRSAKKDRIREWIQSSVIEEDDEEDAEEDEDEESTEQDGERKRRDWESKSKSKEPSDSKEGTQSASH